MFSYVQSSARGGIYNYFVKESSRNWKFFPVVLQLRVIHVPIG